MLSIYLLVSFHIFWIISFITFILFTEKKIRTSVKKYILWYFFYGFVLIFHIFLQFLFIIYYILIFQ